METCLLPDPRGALTEPQSFTQHSDPQSSLEFILLCGFLFPHASGLAVV